MYVRNPSLDALRVPHTQRVVGYHTLTKFFFVCGTLDGDDGNFDDTLSEILGTSSRVATSPDLDLVFGAVDVNVDRACTSLLSPLSHLPPPTSSPPSSAATGEPI